MAAGHRAPRRPGINPPTRHQLALLMALATKGACLRKYGYITHTDDKTLAGRAQLRAPASGMDLSLLPGYTAATLLRAGYVEQVDVITRNDTHYTDYMLTDHGRRVVNAYGGAPNV